MEQAFEFAVSTGFFIYDDWGTEIIRNLEFSKVRQVEVMWSHFREGQNSSHLSPGLKAGIYDDPHKGVTEMKRVLDDIGITCWSLHAPHGVEYDPSSASLSIKQKAEDTLKICLEVLCRLQGKVLVVHASFEPVSDEERPERVEGAIEMLSNLASQCRASGIKMAIENLPRSAIGNRAEELQYLLKGIGADNVGVCLDFAHAFITEGVIEIIERLKSDIITLHICDNTDPNEESTCFPMAPGKGLIDWPPSICALKRAGYKGPAMYEVFSPRGESPQAIKNLRDNYNTLLEFWKAC